MKDRIETTRRQLGELGAMAHQTEAMERRILTRAQELLADVEGKMEASRTKALSGGDGEKQSYMDLVEERGRLQQVIAEAQSALA